MKQILKGGIILLLICLGINNTQAQVFWTETFGTGCNTGTLADGHTTTNGEWTVNAPSSTNGNDANLWYISAAENGEGPGNCGGVGCNGQPTLHIGTATSDLGATYITGGADVNTDAKAISPIIDCSGQCSIQMTYEHLEKGDDIYDKLLVLYYDGTTWTTIQDPPMSPASDCSTNLKWRTRTINLPASADNNPNVQIGFHWVNNDDNIGTDPSAAITNIQLAKHVATPPTLICPSDINTCDPIVSYATPYADTVGNCVAPPFSIVQNDGTGFASGDTFPIGSTHQNFYIEDAMGNISSCGFNIEVMEFPSQAEILTPKEDLCEQHDIFLNASSPSQGSGMWSIIQGTATINNPNLNSVQANNLSFGVNTFVWKVSSAACGETTDTISIEVFKTPSQAKTQDTIRLCSDSLTSIVSTHPLVGTGAWSISNGTASFTDTTVSSTDIYNVSEGWSNVVWTVRNGVCPSSTDTLRFFKETKAKIYNSDTTICMLTQDIELFGNPIANQVSGLWYVASGGADFEDQVGASVIINHLKEGENIIVYKQSNQICGSTTDTLIVIAEQCNEFDPKIPTMITPNNDGKNDYFIIKDLNTLYPEAEVKIVNRWGNLVFQSTGYAEPWNGTQMNNGKKLPMGTYFYRILIKKDNKEITGPISIIR